MAAVAQEREREVSLYVTFQRRRQLVDSRLLLGHRAGSVCGQLVTQIDEMLDAAPRRPMPTTAAIVARTPPMVSPRPNPDVTQFSSDPARSALRNQDPTNDDVDAAERSDHFRNLPALHGLAHERLRRRPDLRSRRFDDPDEKKGRSHPEDTGEDV